MSSSHGHQPTRQGKAAQKARLTISRSLEDLLNVLIKHQLWEQDKSRVVHVLIMPRRLPLGIHIQQTARDGLPLDDLLFVACQLRQELRTLFRSFGQRPRAVGSSLLLARPHVHLARRQPDQGLLVIEAGTDDARGRALAADGLERVAY